MSNCLRVNSFIWRVGGGKFLQRFHIKGVSQPPNDGLNSAHGFHHRCQVSLHIGSCNVP